MVLPALAWCIRRGRAALPSAPWRSARRRSGRSTPTSPPRSTTSPSSTRTPAAYAEAEPLYRARPRDRREGARARAPRPRHLAQQPRQALPGHRPPRRGRAALPSAPSRSARRRCGPEHPDTRQRAQQPRRALPGHRPPTPRPSRSTSAPSRSARRRSGRSTPTSPPGSTTSPCSTGPPAAYAEAEPLFERALAIGEKALGPEHPDTRHRLNNLAALYQATGRHAEAEPLFRRALAIFEKVLPADHPTVAIVRRQSRQSPRRAGRRPGASPRVTLTADSGTPTTGAGTVSRTLILIQGLSISPPMASTPRRPRPLADRARLRLGMRLAAGMAPAQVARVEGLPEAELDALLARPAFARLVEDYRDLARLGREERLARLELLAFDVLEDAIAAGDTRVILWFLTERHAGRDPVRRARRGGRPPGRARRHRPAAAARLAARSRPPRARAPPPRPVRAAPRRLRPPRPRPAGRRGGRPRRRRAAGGLARPPGPRRPPGGLRHRRRPLPRAGAAPVLVAPRPDRGAYRPDRDPLVLGRWPGRAGPRHRGGPA